MREITRIRLSKEAPVLMQMPLFMSQMSQPKIFVRRLGAGLVTKFIAQGAPVAESGMPSVHRFTGKTMKDIERQVRAMGCTALLELDDCDEYLN